ncbi:MAG: AI-2E family transporter [Phycisphaeraceae bacterium]|nr:AI-2E family transporter [Phycisphaeraceae bacterium]
MNEPLWNRRWFQWLIVSLAALAVAAFVLPLVLGLLYAARSVLVPVLAAFALAYIVNPLVNLLHRRLKVRRSLGTAAVMVLAVALVLVVLLLISKPLAQQAGQLVGWLKNDWPTKLQEVLQQTQDATADDKTIAPQTDGSELQTNGSEAQPDNTEAQTDNAAPPPWWLKWVNREQVHDWAGRGSEALANLDWKQVWSLLVSSLDIGVGTVGTAISFTSYLALAAVVTAFCFFFFSWKFQPLCDWFVPFIPRSHRDKTLELLGKMDQTVAAFIRGRLVQATVMGIVLSVGWWIAGVPGFLLLGLLSGALNLIPFAAVIGCAAAVALSAYGAVAGGQFTLWVLLWPVLVYAIAQTLDGWVVEPLVQGKATDLDPVTVLLVVMLGAALGGLLGMMLAIPVAACAKILSKEVLLPKLRELAAEH